jgi:hypothetical protein
MTAAFLGGYLNQPYLNESYLNDAYGELTGMQAELKFGGDQTTGIQVALSQVEAIGQQVTLVLYNDTQLRVLTTFPSRGAAATGGGNNAWGFPKGTGQNWASNSIETGDFSPNNLNTDVPEEVTRSDGLVLNWQLKCDTEIVQGVFLDTLAIYNHNFTRGAIVLLEGSSDPTFTVVTFSELLSVNRGRNDIFYIAPTLPTTGRRYWRLTVTDADNPAGYLEIGIVVFGAAKIFSIEDNFENPIRGGKTHFVDELPTEGFTTIMNDRATRRKLKLDFTDLDYYRGNGARLLEEIFEEVKTDLKALWIPLPQTPARYTVFGKLTEIPEDETRSDGPMEEYIALSVEVDEAR